MILSMILIFIAGYFFIAMEHKLHINKSAFALLMCGALWTIYALFARDANISHELLDHLGDTCEILVFLIGAMTIVDLIDSLGGFSVITDHITTHNKRKLLWLLSLITFFMSAVLDNMTTAIIMIMLLRRIITEKRELWIFASIIVIAANSGGAWSPIGDVTTIMLWMRGNVTSINLMQSLFIPCLASILIPTAIAVRSIGHEALPDASKLEKTAETNPEIRYPRLSRFILVMGIAGLLFVPIFKSLTGLPPYMGMMISLGALWVLTEIIYDHRPNIEESIKNRVSKVLKHIDMSTILFFLGILMSVGALQSAGILANIAQLLDNQMHEVFAINTIIGVFSSIIDNVPLVAACMGMYPIADAAAIAASADPAYLSAFVSDGVFWHLLTYCAGVGGSLLIIGSAAGVVAMGLENIPFGWYFKKITGLAFVGYIAGIFIIWLEHTLLG
ncbi:MAG: sodium:proton antiporter NhaD [Alistipes sp.]